MSGYSFYSLGDYGKIIGYALLAAVGIVALFGDIFDLTPLWASSKVLPFQ